MIKRALLLCLITIALMSSGALWADSGVVLEAQGDVRLKLPSGTVERASVGKKYPDGSTVMTGPNGSAVVITEFGQVFRVGSGTTVKLGERAGDTGMVPVSQGLMLALRETMGGPQGGPRAHGAVKGLGGAAWGEKKTKQSLEKELKEADQLPVVSADAKAIVKGQIYFRYGEYQKVIEQLEPVYRHDKQASLVRDLLSKSYARTGKKFNQ